LELDVAAMVVLRRRIVAVDKRSGDCPVGNLVSVRRAGIAVVAMEFVDDRAGLLLSSTLELYFGTRSG
jgi:hypothetical protein